MQNEYLSFVLLLLDLKAWQDDPEKLEGLITTGELRLGRIALIVACGLDTPGL